MCMLLRSEMQRRNERLEYERNKERLLFMKVALLLLCSVFFCILIFLEQLTFLLQGIVTKVPSQLKNDR